MKWRVVSKPSGGLINTKHSGTAHLVSIRFLTPFKILGLSAKRIETYSTGVRYVKLIHMGVANFWNNWNNYPFSSEYGLEPLNQNPWILGYIDPRNGGKNDNEKTSVYRIFFSLYFVNVTTIACLLISAMASSYHSNKR
jgi:hypothetical protein